MRYAWISLLVVLLDQLIKWFAPVSGTGDFGHLAVGGLSFEIIKTTLSPASDIRTIFANSSTLILLAALLSIHLLITRWSNHFHFLTSKTTIGLQLAGGGLTSQAIDLAFRGNVLSSMRVSLANHYTVSAGLADLALMAGFLLLLVTLLRGSAKVQSKVTLAATDIAPLELSRLPRGIDNIHIDVYLSPRFRNNVKRFIHNLVPLAIRHLQQGKAQVSLPHKQTEPLRQEFSELMSVALHKANNSGEKQIPDLLFISVLKFIHGEVNNSVAAALQKSKEKGTTQTIRGLKAKSNSSFIEWMFRYRDHIIALSNSTVLNAICHKQSRELKKTVKNFFGSKTLFSLQAMEAPMVLAESASNDLIQMENYLSFGQQQDDKNSFINIDWQLAETFSDYLPLIEKDSSRDDRGITFLQGAGGINSNTIDALTQPSVMMNPTNIAILLDDGWTERKLKKTQKLSDWKKHKKLRQHLHFQQRLREKLKSDLLKSGLATWIVAAYEAQKIIKESNSDIAAAQLTTLLSKKITKQEFTQKLPESLRGVKKPPNTETILRAWESIQKDLKSLLEQNLLRFMHNFSHYRHDLLLLLLYQRAATEINLLDNQKDVDTSRANYSLYEFLHQSESIKANSTILSHIIIKADLRGSTEVTEKLTELELNPATHFDRNFFSPINKVIESYGAEKVFIEGDAIILILNEHEGDSQDRLIASRACGLAAKILQIVAKQNRELAAYGLPKLELGIGVAYHQAPPRYLLDGQHRITISPAINRADRLSACTWSIRNWRQSHHAPNHFVEVYQPSQNAISHGEKAQKDMVFNLNGILIEPDVFKRISKELTLKRVNNSLEEISDSSLYAIHFPDLIGTSHSLIVRKAPVHIYDPAYTVEECPVVDERQFYEVLWREDLLEKLRKR